VIETEAGPGGAAPRSELWRLGLGLVLVLFTYAAGLALMAGGLLAVVGPMQFLGRLQALARPADPGAALLLLASFGGLLLGTVLAATACHFRSAGSLFGGWRPTLAGFAIALAVALPAYGLVTAAGFLAGPPPLPGLAADLWLGWLPLALPLLLLQVTAEEALFRGYLQSQLARRFRHPAVWMGLPSALFAALHWDAEAGALVWGILAATFLFGLIAADLTRRTGSIGAAIGLHFVNNVFGLLVISVQGTITGLALYLTPYTLADTGPAAVSLAVNVVFLLAVWRLTLRALRRRRLIRDGGRPEADARAAG
jgi:membrane protease YdiL (CAAX protease family)